MLCNKSIITCLIILMHIFEVSNRPERLGFLKIDNSLVIWCKLCFIDQLWTVLDNQLRVKACDHGEQWKMKTILFMYMYWYTRIFIYSLWSTREIRFFNILVFEMCQIILTPLKSILPLYMNILTYTVFVYFMVSIILKWQFLPPYFYVF